MSVNWVVRQIDPARPKARSPISRSLSMEDHGGSATVAMAAPYLTADVQRPRRGQAPRALAAHRADGPRQPMVKRKANMVVWRDGAPLRGTSALHRRRANSGRRCRQGVFAYHIRLGHWAGFTTFSNMRHDRAGQPIGRAPRRSTCPSPADRASSKQATLPHSQFWRSAVDLRRPRHDLTVCRG